MKLFFVAATLASFILATAAEIACIGPNLEPYRAGSVEYTNTLQDLIDEANRMKKPAVQLVGGKFILDPNREVVLRPGVSLQGSHLAPTIFSVLDANSTATIVVPAENRGWSIKDIVFENVNIKVDPHHNKDESSILGNVFINGGRGSVMADHGQGLYIDGNIFLRDQAHAGTAMIPAYNTTNSGVLFHTQKNSVISNNIFGMDLRHMEDLVPYVSLQLQKSIDKLRFAHDCLHMQFNDEQGYMASSVQLYSTKDITIKENIMNATFPDTHPIAQDHAVSIVGCNQTYIHQNFIAGWQLADFGGAARFTSAVDGYVISNYLANTAVMLYVANHADFMQVSNMVIRDNFFYRFLDHSVDPKPPLDGWLYEGVTMFDFWTARLNYTIRPPIWNSSVPLSPWAWHLVVSNNKFGSAPGIDPNVISLGNIDPKEAFVDRLNCYVTEPLIPGSAEGHLVPLLWRQTFEPGVYTGNGGKIPKRFNFHTEDDLVDNVPAHLRNLAIPSFWKAFTLRNNTVPMMNPNVGCAFGSNL